MSGNAVKLEAHELEQIGLFKMVSPECIEGVLESCRIRELTRGETLLASGETNRDLYILLSGQLRVHLGMGGDDVIATIENGETVGEMSIIDRSPTSAFVVANEDCRLLVMQEEIVWSLVRVSHPAAFNLLSLLTRRLRGADEVIAEKLQREQTYQHFGNFDALTGLHNRHWFDTVLPRHLRRGSVTNSPFSLLLLDIDFFKNFNDTYGHLCGDMAINTVAGVITDNLRPTETAARYGGDEFVILLPDHDASIAKLVAERLRCKIMNTAVVTPDGGLPPLTVSIGVAEGKPGEGAAEIIAAGDAALYRAKLDGRNRVSD